MKKLTIWPFALILALALALPASAHKGRTDSNGGHYDSATGEYHYHHGYPAHSHYDMDGVGDVDCPYDFDDQTNNNSSDSTGSDSNRSQGLTFSDGYESGYGIGYRHGLEDGKEYVESQEESAYNEGYKDGESAAMDAMEGAIQQKVSEARKNAVLSTISIIVFLGYPAWIILSGVFEFFCDLFKPIKKAKPKPSAAKSSPKAKPGEEKSLEAFAYKPGLDTPQPPRFGPANEEFTCIRRSSFISAVCYKDGNLYVKTTQGDYFKYYNVPRPVYIDFMNAPSMGRFFNKNIANNYPFSRL